MPSSRDIPLPMQREVRQRCGFGCVFCGLPLYEYDHVSEWATARQHVAENITLLCDRHHREKTNGLLPVEAVRDASQNPYNLREGVSKPYDLHYNGDSAVDCAVGLRIGQDPRGLGAAIALENVPRYLGDRSEAHRWAKQIFTESTQEKRS
jgi:hypothetical protein